MTKYFQQINFLANCEIWLIPSLNQHLKGHLLAASSAALKLCGKSDWTTSYESLHRIHKRATPMKMLKYKHALELHRLYNDELGRIDWIDLNIQQNFNNRNNKVQIVDYSRLKIGKNLLVNRMTSINNMIPLDWLNLAYTTFKVKCKELLLS